MIFVAVRQRDHVEPLDSARPQIRRDHFFADVDARAHVADVETADQAAAIDQHRASIGESRKQGIALANVEDGQLEIAALETRCKGISRDHDRQCENHGEREPLHGAAWRAQRPR